jgi:nucleoside-diphosphate-sugar epimerase
MRVLILGGGGFLGQKLARSLLQKGSLSFDGQPPRAVTELILFDSIEPAGLPDDPRLSLVSGDLRDETMMRSLLAERVDAIFHLAAIVSGEAERDFELGMDVNLHANLRLLELCRSLAYQPVLVFASSCAVFGGELPDVIEDHMATTPLSSYGTQKAMVELLINDYSRRGFVNGRSLRLPTVVVRPGKPNAATSSFASSIIREPLQGKPAVCPVASETELWIQSPRKVIGNIIHAAELPATSLGKNRIISLPGLTVSVREMVEALEAVGGKEAADRIDWQPDPFIQSIVLTWPAHFNTVRARRQGFERDGSFQEIIEIFVEEELGGV